MTPTYLPQAGVCWRGIFAGALMGLLAVMIMTALALVLSAFLPFSLKGTSIAAGLYATLTSVISALIGGFFSVKCAHIRLAPLGSGKYQPEDTTMISILTAAAIVVATTLLTFSSATSILTTATQTVSHTLPSVEKSVLASLAQQSLNDTPERVAPAATSAQLFIETALKTVIDAEETARQAALFSGLFWLLNALMTFIASFLGARIAAVSYRLDSPIDTLTEEDL